MTEASPEISRHRVNAADTGLRADRQTDAAYIVAAAVGLLAGPDRDGLVTVHVLAESDPQPRSPVAGRAARPASLRALVRGLGINGGREYRTPRIDISASFRRGLQLGGVLGSVRCVPAWHYVVGGEVGVAPQGQVFEEPGEGEGKQGDGRADQEYGVE